MDPQTTEYYDIAPDKFEPNSQADLTQPAVSGFQNRGGGVSPVGPLNSLNFTSNQSGWGLGSSGDAQFNGNRVVSSHFTPIMTLKGLTIYVSDGTSPNGTLSGATGDFCLNGDSGKIYFCVGTTTWVAPS